MPHSNGLVADARWPSSLDTVIKTLAEIPIPSAIFWGSDFCLWHNEPWKEAAGGFAEQGRPYRNVLSPKAVGALKGALGHGPHVSASSGHFLKATEAEDADDDHLVTTCSLPKQNSDEADAVLVQLFGKKPGLHGKGEDKITRHQSLKRHGSTAILTDTTNMPLDEHPFFHRFAEILPTGLAILDHNAQAVFVNKHFYELTTHVEEDQSFKGWPNSIHSDDYEKVIAAYHDAFKSRKALRIEFRAFGEGNLWRLLLLTPLDQENLKHVSLREHGGFICSVVDITSEKSAELAQRKAAEDAQERKEQQERFIDMISHEIRNPLSAILHCAEDILEDIKERTTNDQEYSAITDAADTIILCTNHQRHIVDDVLSFSKLDASMLSLSPRSVQPQPSIAQTLKMFQPEIRKHGLKFEYKVDVSYEDNHVGWVMADLRRIGQIIINLFSNSIKFTAKKDGEKKISIALGASRERPTSYPPSVVFFDPDDTSHRLDATRTSEWGNGEALYLMVAIIDTGIGIKDSDQKKLFERFRQATPKTAEIYGGSGLGLNISRKLCQLHGGDIGVSSKEGQGSTFGFFFKVRRSDASSRGLTADDEERETEELRRQLSVHGLESPSKRGERSEQLEAPKVTHVREVSPHSSTSDRQENTASIASQIPVTQDKESEYALNERPEKVEASRSKPLLDNLSGKDGMETPGKKRDSDDNRTRPKKDAGAETQDSGPRLNILLVEDNIINQKILARKLTAKGFRVTTANNGREAVDAVEKTRSTNGESSEGFDCILMDQEMPVMDGNEATRAIRKLEQQGAVGHMPILGVTANVRDEQRSDMIRAGMDEVIHKPYRIDEMTAKIQSLTG